MVLKRNRKMLGRITQRGPDLMENEPGARKGIANNRAVSERAQPVNTLATKIGDLSSVPETHMVEGQNRLLQAVL